jgi:hypothetical protein
MVSEYKLKATTVYVNAYHHSLYWQYHQWNITFSHLDQHEKYHPACSVNKFTKKVVTDSISFVNIFRLKIRDF